MKKILMALFVGIMISSMMTGCGKPETEDKQVTDVKEDSVSIENEGEGKSDEPRSFTIALRTLNKEYILESLDINEDVWVKELEARTNVDLDIRLMDHAKYTEQMNLMFAGGDIPDVVQSYSVDDASLAGAVEAGVFMPIGDLIKDNADRFPNLNTVIPELAWREMTSDEDGKIYAIPEYLSVPVRRGTYIRKDLLDSLDLEIPVTLDEYVEVMKAFRDAGLKYPFSGRENFTYTDSFFGAFNALPATWITNEEGELLPAVVTDNMKDALRFHRMLVEEGLMDPETLTNKRADWEGKILRGEVGIFTHNANNLASWNARIKNTNENYEFILIPSPVGEDGYSGSFRYASALRGYYINKNVENPLEILDFFEWMLTEEAKAFIAFGIEGQDYTKENDQYIFEYPSDEDGEKLIDYKTNWLALIQDNSYNKMLTPHMPYGAELEEFFTQTAMNEGIVSYEPGNFEARTNLMEIAPVWGKAPELWMRYAAKIFLGQEPIDYYDEFIKEFYARGGQQLIDEATDRYNAGLARKR